MIQFNLLPDVKLQYIKAERTRRLILALSFIVSAVAIGLLVLLFSVGALQKKHLSDLDKDIASKTSQLKGKPDIDRILTVQNQLGSLTALHDEKPAAARLFGNLNQVTPTNIAISGLQVDFTAQTVTITGNTDTLSSVNKYVDTLKFTTYQTEDATDKTRAFSDIVLTSFNLATGSNATNPNQAANYTITMAYDKIIFDTTQKVTLSVPSITTTRSALDKPADLFQSAPAPPSATQKAGN